MLRVVESTSEETANAKEDDGETDSAPLQCPATADTIESEGGDQCPDDADNHQAG
jgi:hypothetical protein